MLSRRVILHAIHCQSLPKTEILQSVFQNQPRQYFKNIKINKKSSVASQCFYNKNPNILSCSTRPYKTWSISATLPQLTSP